MADDELAAVSLLSINRQFHIAKSGRFEQHDCSNSNSKEGASTKGPAAAVAARRKILNNAAKLNLNSAHQSSTRSWNLKQQTD